MKVDNRIVFGVIGAAAMAIFFWGKSCGVKSVIIKEGKPEIKWLKPDTFRIKGDPVPVLVEVVKWKKSLPLSHPGKPKDPIIQFFDVSPLIDTPATVEAFYSTYAYEYSERFQHPTDSAIKGSVHIGDTLSQNMFLGRGVNIRFDSIPKVTKSKVIIPPKKSILYATASAMGNKNDLLFGAGGGFAFKFPDDRIIGVELKYLKGGSLYYEGKIMFPIRLKKK